MKLLFDFNLSPKLVGMLADLFESAHAYSVGLGFQSTDNAIWDFARDHGYTIVTADRDFLNLSEGFRRASKGDSAGENEFFDTNCG